MNKIPEIKKIQNINLGMLREIKRICEKYNLTYFLVGGTFLGAVRHKGFIPWDDDADIGMPRKDYEKFCEIASTKELNSRYTFKSHKIDKEFNSPFSKITYENQKIINYANVKPKIISPWIDIFPFDGMPDKTILKYIHYFHIKIRRKIFLCSIFNETIERKGNRPLYKKILFWCVKKFSIDKLFDTEKSLNKVNKTLKKYGYDNSKYVANFMGEYKSKEILPKRIFEELIDYQFETITLKAPKDYDTFLKRIYGKDYMTPPPEDKRGGHNLKFIEDS